MTSQRSVHEHMVGVNQRKHPPILLEEVREETLGLLLHGAAHRYEGREVSLALLIQRRDIADMQPLATELAGQPGDLGVLDHPAQLHRQHCGLMQFTCSGECAQFGIRSG